MSQVRGKGTPGRLCTQEEADSLLSDWGRTEKHSLSLRRGKNTVLKKNQICQGEMLVLICLSFRGQWGGGGGREVGEKA